MSDDNVSELLEVLSAMAREADAGDDVTTETRARNLLHAAIDRQGTAPSTPRPLWRRGVLQVRRHLVASGSMLAAAAAALVVTLGWSAPAGSPLHDVRLAREAVTLQLPGTNNASLVLGYAEDRLADARAGRNPRASLDEAAALLKTSGDELPATNAGDPLWTRWSNDEAELTALYAQLGSGRGDGTPAPSPPIAAPTSVGGHEPAPSASPSPGSQGGETGSSSGSAPSGEHGGGSSTSAGATSTPTGSDSGGSTVSTSSSLSSGGSSSTSTISSSTSATSSNSGGGSMSSHDASQSSTQTSTASASSTSS